MVLGLRLLALAFSLRDGVFLTGPISDMGGCIF
jgi:hypothetical protein